MPFYPYRSFQGRSASYPRYGYQNRFPRGLYGSLRKSPFRKFRMNLKTTYKNPIRNQQKVMISKKRLPRKSEQKWVHYSQRSTTLLQIPAVSAAANANFVIFWATVGNNADGDAFMPNPAVLQNATNNAADLPTLATFIKNAGGESGVASDRVWFYDYIDMRFNLDRALTTLGTAYCCKVRILGVTQRNSNVSVADLSNFINNGITANARSLNLQLLTKDWKIRYDKVFELGTGYYPNSNAGTAFYQSPSSLNKNFRLKIPFKYRAEFDVPGGTNWSPPLNTYFIALADIANLYNITDVQTRIYFHTKSY